MVVHAPIPAGDEARVHALRGLEILDTGREERFDLFTRIGTWVFQAPFCAINLVDRDRIFFKSLIGFDTYDPARCDSICAHAIGANEPIMEIEDLSRDPRFFDHPLVVENGLRFYAGALLRAQSGHALGTFCIGDGRPRRLTDDERTRLLQLTKGVEAVLQLHEYGMLMLKAATRDSLTGIHNRRHFETELQRAVEAASKERPCALMYLDLDRFKDVNDTLGHPAGDAMLLEVARRLTANARRGDVVARLAGDEFVLLMDGPADTAAVEQLARRLLAALAMPFSFGERNVAIRASIGIAFCPDHAGSSADLLRVADLALYEAKRSGRHCFRMYCEPPAGMGAVAA